MIHARERQCSVQGQRTGVEPCCAGASGRREGGMLHAFTAAPCLLLKTERDLNAQVHDGRYTRAFPVGQPPG